jgi:hypothetical protein
LTRQTFLAKLIRDIPFLKSENSMKRFTLLLSATSLMLIFAVSGYSISIGTPAPALSLTTLAGGTFKLQDHIGEVVVLYTFGCT